MKKLLSLVIVFAALALIATPAMALTYTGSISTPDGIHGTAPWSDDMVITWVVSQNADLSWHYNYSFNYELKAISHMIVAISPEATENDFWNSNHGNLQVGTYQTTDPGNPGLPSDVYGLKIDVVDENNASSFSFDSNKSPVWGDFYIKDGQYDGEDVYAYNSTFGTADPTDDPADGSINYKILRPDSVSTTIPEPSTLLLLGSALAMAGSIRRFRRK